MISWVISGPFNFHFVWFTFLVKSSKTFLSLWLICSFLKELHKSALKLKRQLQWFVTIHRSVAQHELLFQEASARCRVHGALRDSPGSASVDFWRITTSKRKKASVLMFQDPCLDGNRAVWVYKNSQSFKWLKRKLFGSHLKNYLENIDHHDRSFATSDKHFMGSLSNNEHYPASSLRIATRLEDHQL